MKKSLLFIAVAGAFGVFAADIVPGTPRDLNNKVAAGYQSPAVNAEFKIS